MTFRWQLCPLFLLLLVTSGCLRATPAPDYYTLEALAHPTAVNASSADLRLGVVLKGFPEALERLQIVTRDGNRVGLSEQHRWAAPLRQELERVLTTNLGRQLGSERVAVAPWPSYFKPTQRLLVEVLQFDGPLCGEFELQARWVLTDAAGKVAQLQRTSILRVLADCDGYQGYVAAQSRALAQLSDEIALVLKNLSAP